MRKDKGKTDRMKVMGMVAAGMMMALTATGCQGVETSVIMTEKEWATPVIELGETMGFSEDVRDYVNLEQVTSGSDFAIKMNNLFHGKDTTDEDTLYDELALESDVDLTAPGEYTIKVTGYEQEAEFKVVVEDTTYPEMEVKVDNWRTKLGRLFSFDELVDSYNDNDEELLCGLCNFEKVGELEDYDYEAGDTSKVTYEKTKWDASLELVDEITLPEEEGWYRAKVVIADRSGNATTTNINFVTDGTGPVITVPSENVTLSKGVYYDFAEDVTVEDNLYPANRCTLSIDDDEFDVIDDAFVNEKAGTYPLTYTAKDPLGNESTLVINVTIEKKSSTTSDNTSSNSSSWDELAQAKEIFNIINQYREAAGVSALTWDDSLYQGAKIRATECITSYSHTRPNGEQWYTVADEVGCSVNGENLMYTTGYMTSAQIVEIWYNSEGHRENMLRESFTRAVIAGCYNNGEYYWCNWFVE